MRGPLTALWDARLTETYLRFRVALLAARLLAAGGAGVALTIGGVAGVLILSGAIFCVLIGLSVAFAIR
jgi:hypothetical protein